MIHHASLQGTKNVVIVANNSDILFLGAHSYARGKSRRWLYYRYEGKTYADFPNLQDFCGDIELYFPMFHSLTRCDSTSYYHYRGKNIPRNRATKWVSLLLMTEELDKDKTPTNATLDDCM